MKRKVRRVWTDGRGERWLSGLETRAEREARAVRCKEAAKVLEQAAERDREQALREVVESLLEVERGDWLQNEVVMRLAGWMAAEGRSATAQALGSGDGSPASRALRIQEAEKRLAAALLEEGLEAEVDIWWSYYSYIGPQGCEVKWGGENGRRVNAGWREENRDRYRAHVDAEEEARCLVYAQLMRGQCGTAWRDGDEVVVRLPREYRRHRAVSEEKQVVRVRRRDGAVVDLSKPPGRSLRPRADATLVYRPLTGSGAKRTHFDKRKLEDESKSLLGEEAFCRWMNVESHGAWESERDAHSGLTWLVAHSENAQAVLEVDPGLCTLDVLWRLGTRPDGGRRVRERLAQFPSLGETLLKSDGAKFTETAEAIEANRSGREVAQVLQPDRAWIDPHVLDRIGDGTQREMASIGQGQIFIARWHELKEVLEHYALTLGAGGGEEGPWRKEAIQSGAGFALAAPRRFAQMLASQPKRLAGWSGCFRESVGGQYARRDHWEPASGRDWYLGVRVGECLWRSGPESSDAPVAVIGLNEVVEEIEEDLLKPGVWGDPELRGALCLVEAASHREGRDLKGRIEWRLSVAALCSGGWSRIRRICEGLHRPDRVERRLALREGYGRVELPTTFQPPVGWKKEVEDRWPEVRWIGNQQELQDEGRAMQHCVGGYGQAVARVEADIFHVDAKGGPSKGTTLRLQEVWNDNNPVKYRIVEHRSKNNLAPGAVAEELAEALAAGMTRCLKSLPAEEFRLQSQRRYAQRARAQKAGRGKEGRVGTIPPGLQRALWQQVYRDVVKTGWLPEGMGGSKERLHAEACAVGGTRLEMALQIRQQVEKALPGAWAIMEKMEEEE